MLVSKSSYSESAPQILDRKDRLRVARQIDTILKLHVSRMKTKVLLDVGCSSGDITHFLSKRFRKSIGIDCDRKAIEHADGAHKRDGLSFCVSDAERTNFRKNQFDVIVLNQTYEFTKNQKALVGEIYRILKPGGVCLVGARNKVTFLEGQTGLPLLHFFPDSVSVWLASLFGRNYYPARYLALGGLMRLFAAFAVENITGNILKNAGKYRFASLVRYEIVFRRLPTFLVNLAMPLIPNFFFLCRKPR